MMMVYQVLVDVTVDAVCCRVDFRSAHETVGG